MAPDIATQTKKAVRDALRADRTTLDFFVKAPLVIDCSDDADDFTASVTRRQATIIDRFERGELTYVSELVGRSKQWAMRRLRERYAVLDRETTSELERLLRDWQSERNRLPTQARKKPGNRDGGIEIILPVRGIRLKYDLSCLMLSAKCCRSVSNNDRRVLAYSIRLVGRDNMQRGVVCAGPPGRRFEVKTPSVRELCFPFRQLRLKAADGKLCRLFNGGKACCGVRWLFAR